MPTLSTLSTYPLPRCYPAYSSGVLAPRGVYNVQCTERTAVKYSAQCRLTVRNTECKCTVQSGDRGLQSNMVHSVLYCCVHCTLYIEEKQHPLCTVHTTQCTVQSGESGLQSNSLLLSNRAERESETSREEFSSLKGR